MIRDIKLTALQALRGAGFYGAVSRSRWRRHRLLVLCYHGISLEDEHAWNAGLYIEPAQFERRMQHLLENRYQVLALNEGLDRVRRGDLPERSVALTFDDGMYDFYALAWPVIRRLKIPVTVYLTTYHCDHNLPIFRMTCSYLLWRRRSGVLDTTGLAGLPSEKLDLSAASSRSRLMFALDRYAKAAAMSGAEKDGLIRQLAARLEIDYGEVVRNRKLHIMNPAEVSELAAAGVDFQLHTHRHRTPLDRGLFRREIEDNASRLLAMTGRQPRHFCYPSGVHDVRFFPWLEELGIESATTCDAGFVNASSNWYALPRMLDHSAVSDVEFEGWLTGLRALLPLRKVAVQDPDSLSDPNVWSGAPG